MTISNLVTGGAGFIGSNLIENLLINKQKVICLDNLSSGSLSNLEKFKNNKNFSFINRNVVEELDLNVERIWHFGSIASENHYSKDPIASLNNLFKGANNLLQLAKRNNARILLASSSEIYGNYSKKSFEENFLGSVNCFSRRAAYSEGKRVSETLFFNYHKIHCVDIRIARIFNTYGPGLNFNDGRVISSFINNAINGKVLKIYGDGSQSRSFCFISDMVEALIALMSSNYVKPINLGNTEEISILNLANMISEKLGSKLCIDFLDPKENEPYKRKPRIDLAREILKWEPKVKLDSGLDITIRYFLENQS